MYWKLFILCTLKTYRKKLEKIPLIRESFEIRFLPCYKLSGYVLLNSYVEASLCWHLGVTWMEMITSEWLRGLLDMEK